MFWYNCKLKIIDYYQNLFKIYFKQSLCTVNNLKRLLCREVNRNNLQQIHGLSLKHLTKLRELHLKRNKIEMLDDGAFWPLNNLIMLHLDFNMLTSIRKGGLFGLTSLQTLTLSHNQISSIELQAWEQCLKITEMSVMNL